MPFKNRELYRNAQHEIKNPFELNKKRR